MNVQYAAKVRHMRGSEDIAAIQAQAALRYERRLHEFVRLRDEVGWPSSALWVALDRLNEAARLTLDLESRRQDIEESAAERHWLNIYAEQINA